jgi:16S rRNA processing protein RimM
VRVQLHWPSSDALQCVEQIQLLIGAERRSFAIESVRRANKVMLVKFAGVSGRDAADALRGAKVLVPRDALPKMAEDEYYLADLIGCRVTGPAGLIGEVIEVRAHPTVDTIVIRAPDGTTCEQPLADHWLEWVDLQEREVRLATLDGLIA